MCLVFVPSKSSVIRSTAICFSQWLPDMPARAGRTLDELWMGTLYGVPRIRGIHLSVPRTEYGYVLCKRRRHWSWIDDVDAYMAHAMGWTG